MIKKNKYDAVKAHEYYMKHRKLKGRKKAKVKASGEIKRKKKKKSRYVAPKNIALATKSSGGKGTKITNMDEFEFIKAKMEDIKKRAVKLPPKKKKALKSALIAMRGKIKG